MAKDILDLEKKKEIYLIISKNPGLSLSELSRMLKIPKSTMFYHLHYLVKHGILTTEVHGRYKRYFITNNIGNKEKKIFSILRQEVPFEIILFLFLNKESSKKEISKYLKKDRSTINQNLNKLINDDLIERIIIKDNVRYRIKNKNDVSGLIIKYMGSFFK